MITFLIISIILFFGCIFFVVKYFLLRKGLKKYESVGTGRVGFHKDYTTMIYIKEIDRYTNGYSKIIIDNIETSSSMRKEMILRDFKYLVRTERIEWLESEDYIKQSRKEKLSKLKKI